MEDLSSAEIEKISKINSAGLINIRINEILMDVNNHSRKGNFQAWNADLDCFWRELGGDVKPEGEEYKDIKDINEDLEKLEPLFNPSLRSGFIKLSTTITKTLKQQYNLLMKKELLLRRLLNKQGKGTAYYDPSEDDFE